MDIHLKHCIKHWLSGFESKSMQKIGIDVDRVADFFGTNVWETLIDRVRNLVGKTWMTDNEIDYA